MVVSDWERKPADSDQQNLKQINVDLGDLTSCGVVRKYILKMPYRIVVESVSTGILLFSMLECV
jgi:hypothetical protein